MPKPRAKMRMRPAGAGQRVVPVVVELLVQLDDVVVEIPAVEAEPEVVMQLQFLPLSLLR